MLKKILRWTLGVVLLLGLLVFVVLPMLVNTEAGRKKLAELLGRALDREVTIGDLDVGWFFGSIDVKDLRIANPEGFPAGSMIRAESLHMDASLRKLIGGTIQSGLSGSGLQLHVIRRGGKTNLDGFGGRRKPRREKEVEIPDLDLALRLTDGRLILEDLDKGERVEVNGVSTNMRLTNIGDVQSAGLTITVASVDNKTLRVRDLVLDSKLEGDFLEVRELSAILPGKGTLGGDGRMRVRGGSGWQFRFDMKHVGIDGDMMPFVAAIYPLAATAGGQVDGILDGGFELTGDGLSWNRIKPTLTGKGRVTLTDLGLPAQSIVAQLTQAAGGKAEALAFNNAGAEFSIRNGWLEFHRLSASGAAARYDLAGKVSLDGDLRLTMDLMPLVKQFGGGSTYRKIAKYAKRIPVRIEGTTARPSLELPRAEDLVDSVGEGLIEKGLGEVLDKIRRK